VLKLDEITYGHLTADKLPRVVRDMAVAMGKQIKLEMDGAETELDRLLARKAVVYSNLKDLEFEYKMGRLSEGDYRRLSEWLVAGAR
jgi:UDP-galactopyranose mutase